MKIQMSAILTLLSHYSLSEIFEVKIFLTFFQILISRERLYASESDG